MSFETKLVNLVNKIYKNCVFRDRNGLFRKYSLESRVQLIPNVFTKEENSHIACVSSPSGYKRVSVVTVTKVLPPGLDVNTLGEKIED